MDQADYILQPGIAVRVSRDRAAPWNHGGGALPLIQRRNSDTPLAKMIQATTRRNSVSFTRKWR